MLRLSAAVLFATLATGASPQAEPDCVRGTGTHEGYFYTSWRDSGEVCMTLGEAGRYTVTWDLGGRGNMVVGKGWRTGSTSRTIGYRASTFEPGTNGYLALYGRTTDPLVEYYVVDNWGTATFYQYWSVRTARRDRGADNAITFANHVAAWRSHGQELGTMNYQVLATEGFGGTGRSDVTVWED